MLREISIHAPLAGRDGGSAVELTDTDISIHAPLAGRDMRPLEVAGMAEPFQSTRPLRGATVLVGGKDLGQSISIHAPLAGRDCLMD